MSGSLLAALMMDFTRCSKSPRYLVPATTDAISNEMIRFFAKTLDIEPSAILRAMPSTIADFPTPGSPMSMGLFFFLLPRISISLEISRSRPTTGSSLPSAAALVRSMPNSQMSFTGSFFGACSASLTSSPSSLVSLCLSSIPFFDI